MLFLPFAFVCGLIYGQRRKQLLLAAMMFAGFVVVMLPWWVRNYRVTGHFVPTTLQVGASLYDGWNPQATGASDMRFVPEFEAAQRKSDADHARRRLRVSARPPLPPGGLGLGRANPGRVVQLAGIKFLRLWNFWPNEPSFAAWPVRLAVLATYLPLMLLAALGFAAGAVVRLGRRTVLAAGRLLHALAHGVRQFDSLSAAGHAGTDRAGGRLSGGVQEDRLNPANGIAAILPKRLINFCWFWFKWGLIACVIGAALLVPYFYHRIDKEIRHRVQELLAKQYPGLQVKIHSAMLMKGEGIALRGLSIIDPAAEGPGAELLSFEECFLACSTDLSDLYSGQLRLKRVIIRRPTLRMTRRPDGAWSSARLLPLPKLDDDGLPEIRFENGTIEIFDPTKAVACTLTLRDVNLTLSPIAPPEGRTETTRQRADPGHGHRRLFPPGDFRRRSRSRPPRVEPRRQDRRRGDFARDAQCPARLLRGAIFPCWPRCEGRPRPASRSVMIRRRRSGGSSTLPASWPAAASTTRGCRVR